VSEAIYSKGTFRQGPVRTRTRTRRTLARLPAAPAACAHNWIPSVSGRHIMCVPAQGPTAGRAGAGRGARDRRSGAPDPRPRAHSVRAGRHWRRAHERKRQPASCETTRGVPSGRGRQVGLGARAGAGRVPARRIGADGQQARAGAVRACVGTDERASSRGRSGRCAERTGRAAGCAGGGRGQ
jgi:hypothetical protein